jgi:mannosyltransferase OCH1-like enzyme
LVAEAVIPKIFHAIWIGDDMPAWRVRCWRTWAQYHPDWQTRFWRVPSSDDDPRHRADLLRYAILYLDGGIYVDTDFECLRPLDSLLHGVDAFAASEDGQSISIGILGCGRFHPTLEAILRALPQSVVGSVDIGERAGPAFLTRTVADQGLRLTVFPSWMFYPYSGDLARRGVPFDRASAPEAYAVHLWGGLTTCNL